MDKDLEKYLEAVNQSLKPMPLSERLDIVKEIKSHIEELSKDRGMCSREILKQLEPPKELAKAYLGNSICKSNSNSFNWRKFLMVLSFYSLAGFSGMFILPIFSVLAGGLKFCAIIAFIAGPLEIISYLLGFDLPFALMQFGPFTPHPLLAFPLSIIMGIIFLFAGHKSWQVVIKYINTFNKKKEGLHRS